MIHWFFAVAGKIAAAIQAAPQGGTAAVGVVALIALGGLIAGISPDGLAGALAVVGQVGMMDERRPSRHGLRIAVAFSLGLVLALAALGLATAFAGQLVLGLHLARWFPVLTLAMGLHMLGIVRWTWFRLPGGRGAVASRPVSAVSAFALGVPFGLAASPCTLPILVTVLTVAAARGSGVFGLVELTAFGLGRSVPVLLLGHISDRALALPRLRRLSPSLRRGSGALIIVISVYVLNLGRGLLG